VHNVANALAAAAAACTLSFDRRLIAEGLAAFRPLPGRGEIRLLENGAFLIMDTYNANPASVRKALQTLQELRRRGAATAILGDMLELGERAEELHEEIGTLLTKTGVDAVFLKGTLTRAMAAAAIRGGLPAERIVFFDDPRQVIDHLRLHLKKDDWILIKGSRKMKMEEVAEALIEAFDRKPQTM